MKNNFRKRVPIFFRFTSSAFKVYKLSILLLIICVSELYAVPTPIQKTRIQYSNRCMTIEDLFSTIEEQTDYLIVFSNNLINTKRKVRLNDTNQTIEESLKNALTDTNLQFEISDKYIILSKKSIAKTDIVSKLKQNELIGKVVDKAGSPIAGASVVVENSSAWAITDNNGKFVLNAPIGSSIKISFIGFKERIIKVSSLKELNIVLEQDTQTLEDVVVVAFGTQKKVNLTGSVSVVDTKEVATRPVDNLTNALQGLVPGLQISNNSGSVSANPSINIRGIGTIGEGSSGSPLILIDGMEGNINTINPENIANISVLKDAAASSIYGSRAPFGVILITTKSGNNGKTHVTYSNNLRWSTPVNVPDIVDSYTYASYVNLACANDGKSLFFNEERLNNIKDYYNGVIDTEIPPASSGNNWAKAFNYGNANNNWYDIFYKDVYTSQQHNLSFNGGNENVNYYMSLGYLGKNGLLDAGTESLDRYNGSAKFNMKLSPWANMSYNIKFIRSDYVQPTSFSNYFFVSLIGEWPVTPMYDPNGYCYNNLYLQLANGGDKKTQIDDISHQLSFVLEPIKNWETHFEFNFRNYYKSIHAAKLKTYVYDQDRNPYPSGNTESKVSESSQRNNYYNVNIYSKYNTTINQNHNFTALLGFQAEKYKRKNLGLSRNGIIVPSLDEIDITTGLDSDGGTVSPSVSGSSGAWSTIGLFGRLNYDYRGKYLAEINLRYDGTSRFRGNKIWNWFPSFSMGWNVAKEDFWKSYTDICNELKFRFSYGELGNQNTTNWYQTYQTINTKAASGAWLQGGVKPNVAISPDLVSSSLGWEKVSTYNIAVDFSLFNNRLTGTAEYFGRYTDDMVGDAPELPSTLGTDVPVINNTNLKTIGWELQIGWKDLLQNGIGYSARVSLSDARTKITKYPNNPTNSISSTLAGYYTGNIWGYVTEGIAKTDAEMDAHLATLPNGGQDALGSLWSAGDIMYKDLNNDGKISSGAGTTYDPGDKKIIGNSTPRYLLGVNLAANWKNFDVSMYFQGVLKRDYFQGSWYFWGVAGAKSRTTCFSEHLDFFRNETYEAFTDTNADAYYARPSFTRRNKQVQTKYLQDASYVRLKNLQIGYTLPKSFSKKLCINKCRIYVSGENLLTFSHMTDIFDPETISGGYGWGNSYPLAKTYSIGINLTF